MCELEEENDLNIGKLIYLDIRYKYKPIFVCSNHWTILQDSDTNNTLFGLDQVMIS